MAARIFVTFHHEMSRNVPDGHFHVLYILKVNSMLFTMVKTRGLVAELQVFECGGTTLGTYEKTCFKC